MSKHSLADAYAVRRRKAGQQSTDKKEDELMTPDMEPMSDDPSMLLDGGGLDGTEEEQAEQLMPEDRVSEIIRKIRNKNVR